MDRFSTTDAWRIILIGMVLAVATIGSSRYGTPQHLSDAAMSWPLLFHLERAAVLLAAPAVVILVGR